MIRFTLLRSTVLVLALSVTAVAPAFAANGYFQEAGSTMITAVGNHPNMSSGTAAMWARSVINGVDFPVSFFTDGTSSEVSAPGSSGVVDLSVALTPKVRVSSTLVNVMAKLSVTTPGGNVPFACRTSTLNTALSIPANTWSNIPVCNSDEIMLGGGVECSAGNLKGINSSTSGPNWIAGKCTSAGSHNARAQCCKF